MSRSSCRIRSPRTSLIRLWWNNSSFTLIGWKPCIAPTPKEVSDDRRSSLVAAWRSGHKKESKYFITVLLVVSLRCLIPLLRRGNSHASYPHWFSSCSSLGVTQPFSWRNVRSSYWEQTRMHEVQSDVLFLPCSPHVVHTPSGRFRPWRTVPRPYFKSEMKKPTQTRAKVSASEYGYIGLSVVGIASPSIFPWT